MKISHILPLFVLALALVVAVGCGPKKRVLIPVEGTLTLDGEAVEGATVAFTPKDSAVGIDAAGNCDASGKFVMTTDVDQGVVPGEYYVSVYKVITEGDSVLTVKTRNEFPEKYADPSASGLTATVAKGMEPLKFELTK